jgi:DNA-binding NtrC family response regulator
MRHPLPGNVRELENIIEYCFVLCRNGLIGVEHLPDDLKPDGYPEEGTPQEPEAMAPLQESEADAIRTALGRNKGNRARTADDLQISRTTLWRKMKRYGIRSEDFEAS